MWSTCIGDPASEEASEEPCDVSMAIGVGCLVTCLEVLGKETLGVGDDGDGRVGIMEVFWSSLDEICRVLGMMGGGAGVERGWAAGTAFVFLLSFGLDILILLLANLFPIAEMASPTSLAVPLMMIDLVVEFGVGGVIMTLA